VRVTQDPIGPQSISTFNVHVDRWTPQGGPSTAEPAWRREFPLGLPRYLAESPCFSRVERTGCSKPTIDGMVESLLLGRACHRQEGFCGRCSRGCIYSEVCSNGNSTDNFLRHSSHCLSLRRSKMVPAITARYDWILAITTIAFVFSAFGNGANDVANSYASMSNTENWINGTDLLASVAAQTLNMKQVGFLSIITEFVGAVALGSRVTDTIKNGIINIDRFQAAANPGTLMLAMGCAEVGSATWLMFATVCGPIKGDRDRCS
jgi:hypothetical protein